MLDNIAATEKAVVVIVGVKENVNVLAAVGVRVVVDDVMATLKSDASAYVDAAIVHVMSDLYRCGVTLLHDSCDDVVGTPYTGIESGLFAMSALPINVVMTKADENVVGVVENVNIEPPATDVSVIDVLAVELAVKSEGTAVVAPFWSVAVIVHVMGVLMRCNDVYVHDSVDWDVGMP